MMLIDSSIYISLIRQGQDVRFVLRRLIQGGEILSCGLVRAEVVRGARSPKIRNDLSDMFDVLPEIPTDAKLWREVTDLAWRLDRQGVVLPIADLVIASCALRAKAMLVSLDEHFTKVPGLQTSREIPRGA